MDTNTNAPVATKSTHKSPHPKVPPGLLKAMDKWVKTPGRSRGALATLSGVEYSIIKRVMDRAQSGVSKATLETLTKFLAKENGVPDKLEEKGQERHWLFTDAITVKVADTPEALADALARRMIGDALKRIQKEMGL